MKYLRILTFLFATVGFSMFAMAQQGYKMPPEKIAKLADAPLTPSVLLDQKGEFVVFLHRSAYTSIKELSQEEYRLAGTRINPRTMGPSRMSLVNNLTYRKVNEKEDKQVQGLPDPSLIANLTWSPDYSSIAFTNQTDHGLELWVLDVAKGVARKITEPIVHDVLSGSPVQWLPDGRTLLVRARPAVEKSLIPANNVPSGPIVQENLGKTAAVRTYQDMLESPADEQNFEILATSRLIKVTVDGKSTDFLPDAMYNGQDLSPDGKYLLVETLKRPFSYLVPYSRFPHTISIVDVTSGKTIKVLEEAGLDEDRPKGTMSTTDRPRGHSWRADMPSAVYWVQALDKGDQSVNVPHRDALYVLDAPFQSPAREIVRTKNRFRNVKWGNSSLAIVNDYWWNTRTENTYLIDPSKSSRPEPMFTKNTEDIYADPGDFAMTENSMGRDVLLLSKSAKYLYLMGEGYGPEGNRPFIDEFDIKKRSAKRIWQADGKTTYEAITDILDIEAGVIVTRIESTDVNPNYYFRNIKSGSLTQFTYFPDPYEDLAGVTKEFVTYKRKDGVDLTAVLYLPANYKKGTRLPVFLWAYPREFKDASTAGMVKESPHRFTRLSYGSPIFWASMGYAVLDRTDFPIIGEGEKEPNDTYVEQLIANAEAAIEELDRREVADPQRIGVGGHSYGAFMTANLLAHSDLFAAGIARSGAYNRTLTPFGFQNEERTFWEAPDVYFEMSPFMHAHKINEPLLMIHGTHDNNSGTFPIQSERMYAAIKGHGGTARFVKLPYESHGYAARESVMHMLWEMDTWLETYVKNKEKIPSQKIEIEK